MTLLLGTKGPCRCQAPSSRHPRPLVRRTPRVLCRCPERAGPRRSRSKQLQAFLSRAPQALCLCQVQAAALVSPRQAPRARCLFRAKAVILISQSQASRARCLCRAKAVAQGFRGRKALQAFRSQARAVAQVRAARRRYRCRAATHMRARVARARCHCPEALRRQKNFHQAPSTSAKRQPPRPAMGASVLRPPQTPSRPTAEASTFRKRRLRRHQPRVALISSKLRSHPQRPAAASTSPSRHTLGRVQTPPCQTTA